MANFTFQAFQSGKPIVGAISASDLSTAAELLHARSLIIVDLAPMETVTANQKKFSLDFPPSTKEIAGFTAQLAVMIRAGISIRLALDAIADQTVHPGLRRILLGMQNDIENGKSFSDALARHPKTFSPLYINMVRASEMSGGFPRMLDRISGYLNQQLETRNMVVAAMTYPAIIAILAIATTIFLLVFVLPRFMVLFAGRESALPWSTKLLMATSGFLVSYGWLVLSYGVAVIWGVVLWLRTEFGREHFDRAKLKLPLFRNLFRALYISRGLHTMGQLVNAGVPILQTLAITADVSGNVLYYRMWRSVYAAVKEGRRIATPLQASPLLPRAVVQMINAGEESGRLGEVLDEVSEFYARELKSVLKTVTSLIEPAMILVMGGVVGFIATSIILPIFKLSQIMGK